VIKLPNNPSDRKKVIAAIGVGAIGILYLLFTFALQPYLANMNMRRARIAELEDSIWRAEKDLNSADLNMESNAAIVKDLLTVSEVRHFILRPSLGNYLLVANGILRSASERLQISLDIISEVPQNVPKRQEQDEKNTSETSRFAPYTVSLNITAGMHALVKVLHQIETENPYVTLMRLMIMKQENTTPEEHVVNMHIQWPIWVDNDHPRRLEAEQIADEERQ